MKKITSVLLILTLACLAFTACNKSDATVACEKLIKEIGEVTLDKLELIENAEKAYALLTGEEKSDVKNFDDLADARKSYNDIKAFADSADELSGMLDRVFKEYEITAADITEAFSGLENSLSAAPEKAKAQFDSIFAPVKEKHDAFLNEASNAVPSAAAYLKGFYEINKDKNITIDSIGCILQVADGTSYYLFALSFTEDGQEKTVYSTARFANKPSLETMLSYKDNFYSDAPLSEKLDALENGNLVIDTAKAVEEASK